MFADILEPCQGHILIYLKSNATASYSTLECEFRVGMSVFVLVCVTPPTASLPSSNTISCQLPENTVFRINFIA